MIIIFILYIINISTENFELQEGSRAKFTKIAKRQSVDSSATPWDAIRGGDRLFTFHTFLIPLPA